MMAVACPVHHFRVAVSQEGRVIGRCQGCIEDAADALTLIQTGVARARSWAELTLVRFRSEA